MKALALFLGLHMRTKNNFILYNEITMVPVLLWLTVYEALHLYLTKVDTLFLLL